MRSREAFPVPRRRREALLIAAVLGLSSGACEEEVDPPPVFTLDGPTDISFACYGRLRVTGGQPPDESQPIVTTLLPMELCQGWNRVTFTLHDNDTTDRGDDYYTLDELPPEGQGPLGLTQGQRLSQDGLDALDEWFDSIHMYGFALQRNQGTVALVNQRLGSTPTAALLDADPFAPGRNVIPVGTQPVGIVTDPTSCHVMTANAGSCDLSVLDVPSLVSGGDVPVVRTVSVRNAAGEPLAARPRAIVAEAPQPTTGEPMASECSDSPDSLIYVAYPDCHAVAAIHAGTGEIRASIVFAEDGSAILGDGNLDCAAAACGAATTPPVVEVPDAGAPDAAAPDAAVPDAGVPDAGLVALAEHTRPRPVALHMASDGARLYIGAENSSQITVVDLRPEDGLPMAATSVALDCEQDPRTGQCRDDDGDGEPDPVGVTALAATDLIPMGGEPISGKLTPEGTEPVLDNDGQLGDHRFVYAAATDNTVRVVEVEALMRECDTQIDPRFLHDIRADGSDPRLSLLACLPVGDPAFPRRLGARSPGIHVPGDARPLDIAFARAPGGEKFQCAVPPDTESEEPQCASPPISAINLIGYFAYISLSTGAVVMVNVDDDNYGDVESTTGEYVEVDLSLALPHQLRDTGTARRSSLYCEEAGTDSSAYRPLVCDFDVAEDCSYQGGAPQGPPSLTAPSVTTLSAGYVAEGYLPALPALRALECVDEDGSAAVEELSLMAPDPLREMVFPDLQSVRTEAWNIVWEGRISRQSAGAFEPGVRLGYAERDGGFALRDGGSPFCEMGAEPGDVVTLRGCDPERGDGDCQAFETCAVLPDIDVQTQIGICLPRGSEDLVQGSCLPFFASRRRFVVEQAFADRLVLAERKRVLRTTPAEGCSSDTQCAALYDLEQALALGAPLAAESPQSTDRWSCEPEAAPDPDGAPARDVCVMRCADDSECENGWQCSGGGYCVEAALPPAECVQTLQRYDVRVGDAFAVIGTFTGFLHDRVADPVTGECVADPTINPLARGRLPLTAPPCTGEGFLDVAPNPCATTVEHYEEEGGERQAQAIRFRNPTFVTHLVDPVFDPAAQGISCSLDGAACPPMTAVPPNYAIAFTIGSGFAPLNAVSELRFPIGLVADPLGSLWIMDQGDASAAVRGQIARFAPLTLQVTAVIQ